MRPQVHDPEHEERARAGLEEALATGGAMLNRRESAVDAVEAKCTSLVTPPC